MNTASGFTGVVSTPSPTAPLGGGTGGAGQTGTGAGVPPASSMIMSLTSMGGSSASVNTGINTAPTTQVSISGAGTTGAASGTGTSSGSTGTATSNHASSLRHPRSGDKASLWFGVLIGVVAGSAFL
ncbi:hypothetical protein E1B28_002958 [Marasmius oreades]|uniref:Uncharacterized protein n=1 Tax=Marasmius oreades TaxID=181124 RepID=A0A9P7UIX5_9AGAR|nr:uncharacterized protein E1B28_002958 [Marasmius oreades]KAG7085397.1 hypothetical protein E1B28_002958 [Marasmius oreades]